MDSQTIIAFLPQLILAAGTVGALLLVAWRRSQRMIAYFTLVTLLLTLVSTFNGIGQLTTAVTQLFYVDDYGRFALLLILLVSICSLFLSMQRLSTDVEVHDEYYLLMLLTVLGGSILVISDHFASLFLGFELLSISLVGLVGYFRQQQYSVESSFKYLILSASASSFMLLGIAFIYAQTGTLSFSPSADITGVSSLSLANNYLLPLGFILFFSGMAFKLSLVPFHYWTPDVYQGASTPVTLLVATVSKCAIFVVLLKCCFAYYQHYMGLHEQVFNVIAAVAILSMILGNSLALKQQSIKRILAYSSIAHMGYLLIIVLLNQVHAIEMAWQSTLFYLTTYLIACVSIFTVICLSEGEQHQDVNLADWQGLFWHRPLLASLVIVAVLSFAGIPLTAGFIGKFYLINLAANQAMWPLLAALIIGSGVALAYYLPMVFTLFTEQGQSDKKYDHLLSFGHRSMVSLFIVLGLLLGIFPDVLGHWLLEF
ncbi:NADH-quinone oxidoreductase subunit N [Thalassotalea sp. G2M2-11]|uniref:NADH-quinone oxidoreductase subunit N n=1 Tax=Thalassotalea sp. G2M2-11 TaxID=2787627 RepID=UPI0019D20624|nr:NADH-quinone oxidoreductase subunit N [Thalassotalea sp. G2M2-11]